MYNDDEARLMSMSAFSFILFLQSRVKFCHVCVSVVVCALWSVCFKNSSAHRRPPWSKNQRESIVRLYNSILANLSWALLLDTLFHLILS